MVYSATKRKYTNFSGGGRDKFQRNKFNEGPPDEVIEIGQHVHSCEGDLVVQSTHQKIPYFNALIYLENKISIGKVDEIFGPINDFFFSVKLSEGYHSTSIMRGQKLFIDPSKLLPLSRFLPSPLGVTKTQSRPTTPKYNSDFTGNSQGRGFSRFGSRRGGSQRGGFQQRGGFKGGFNKNRNFSGSGRRGGRGKF